MPWRRIVDGCGHRRFGRGRCPGHRFCDGKCPRYRSVTADAISSGAVTAAAVAAGAIGNDELPGVCGAGQPAGKRRGRLALGDGVVGSVHLQPNAVEQQNIAPGSISPDKLDVISDRGCDKPPAASALQMTLALIPAPPMASLTVRA